MSRIFLIVFASGVVVIALAAGFLGAFPPTPVQHHVEYTVPNAKIKGP
jgi:hypothetical protein